MQRAGGQDYRDCQGQQTFPRQTAGKGDKIQGWVHHPDLVYSKALSWSMGMGTFEMFGPDFWFWFCHFITSSLGVVTPSVDVSTTSTKKWETEIHLWIAVGTH